MWCRYLQFHHLLAVESTPCSPTCVETFRVATITTHFTCNPCFNTKIAMLWSALTMTSKMYVVFGCSLVLAISLAFVICFLLPDRWSLCPTEASDYDPSQDAFDDSLPVSHLETYRPTVENDVTSPPSSPRSAQNTEDRISIGAESTIKTHRMSGSSSTTADSVDSGRPSSSSGVGSSSSVISETTATSPHGSRRTSLAPVPNDCEAAVHSETSGDRTPQIHLTIRCLTDVQRNDPDQEPKLRLTLFIENATDLPRRAYVDTADPTVIVRLERRIARTGLVSAIIAAATHRPSFRSAEENELLFLDASCPVAYHCRSAGFEHLVRLPDLSQADRIKDCQLVLRVEDRDKLAGTSELCSCRIDLSEILDRMDGTGSIHLTRHLERAADERGDNGKGRVLLGLSFLPTSERIAVRITQFQQLPKWAGPSADPGQVIVRLFVLNESGRVVNKRKTAPRRYPADGRIEFDEQFAVELDAERWQRSVVLVVLSRIVEDAGSGRGRLPPVYEHLGHVALGRRVACAPERIHWNSGLRTPRRVISHWHHLH